MRNGELTENVTAENKSCCNIGMSPTEAARDAISRIVRKFPDFSGAIVAVNIQEEHGAATHGFQRFPYSYRLMHDNETHVVTVIPHIRRGRSLQVAAQ